MKMLPSLRAIAPRSGRAIVTFLLTLSVLSANGFETRSNQSLPKEIKDSTVRVKVETRVGSQMVAGRGSAFGVDLSNYGLVQPRYLLTAAHMVLAEDGSGLINGRVSVELGTARNKRWIPCRILSVTRTYDLCLLECDEDVPVISQLTPGKRSIKVGERLLVVGCPLGVPPQVSTGYLRNKDPLVSERYHRVWEANAAFNHGNSGGPVFCASCGTVVGVAVAGVRAGGGGPQDMDPGVALFTPYYCVKNFLDVSIEKMTKTASN